MKDSIHIRTNRDFKKIVKEQSLIRKRSISFLYHEAMIFYFDNKKIDDNEIKKVHFRYKYEKERQEYMSDNFKFLNSIGKIDRFIWLSHVKTSNVNPDIVRKLILNELKGWALLSDEIIKDNQLIIGKYKLYLEDYSSLDKYIQHKIKNVNGYEIGNK